ncbi:MAG: alanine--glyoxylate aminotransferase family protein [Dehalococcoidia bacterium]|nr:alanine--glyoxylate aminotransferase family protein [Dehalococcoidia bacterium]
MQLRIPGPTPIPDEILKALSKQMIGHRGPQFTEIVRRVTENLRDIFQTEGDIFILTSSGTGGMEAAIVNTLSPGDKVLSVANGAFGDRFADIAETFGAELERLRFEWGTAADPQEVRKALSKDAGVKAVLVTHNETSTGVTNDLESISAVVREYDKLLIVDAISSLGAINLPVDRWGCDVVVTGSQKAWMSPPGLAMVSVSERAWKAHAKAKMPRFYWDFTKFKKSLDKLQTPFTPAVSMFYALDTALELFQREGLQNIFTRHARIAAKTRDEVKSLGLSLFADERYASNAVTAIKATKGLDSKLLLKILREEYDTVLAGGQQRLDGQIFRIGHVGYVSEQDIDAVVTALKAALPKAGFSG